MFEVGFSELLLIFVIALMVLGPERLPKLVAQVGRWAGKAKAMARQFREQLESEVNLEELTKANAARPEPKAYTEAPAAEAPVPDPSAPAAPTHDASVPPTVYAEPPAPAHPWIAPADDFAHHPTPDAPPATTVVTEPTHSTAETPVVSTHERL